MIRIRVLLFLVLSVCAAGCTTISSTMLNRTDNDVFVGNSNGDPNNNCGATPFKGIPITVKVPTHVDVAIRETYYLALNNGKLKELSVRHRNLDVETTLVETEKLFTVDFPRPASGSLDYGLDLDPATQYFTGIENTIIDNTIADVSSAINSLIPVIAAQTGAAGGLDVSDDLKKHLIVDTRVVAWKRFDINSPDIEFQVRDFVDKHVNCCNSCKQNLTPTNAPQEQWITPISPAVIPLVPEAAPENDSASLFDTRTRYPNDLTSQFSLLSRP